VIVERVALLTESIIRAACLDDAEALHRHCYPEHTPGDVRDYLAWCLRQAEKGKIVRLVAEIEGQVVGNAQLTIRGQDGEIGSLVVARDFRRQGLARRLLTELIAEAKRRGLATLEIGADESQPGILAFYQGLGFRKIPSLTDPGRKEEPSYPEPVVLLRMLL
jgi:ribosomal protein S18 acetylase RimI-like enzyme